MVFPVVLPATIAAMLLKQATLELIAAGRVTLAFRRWQRPTVRAGGTLRTSIGVLAIDAVKEVTLSSLTPCDARHAGFDSLDALLAELRRHKGNVYRIALRLAGPDPRRALREDDALSASGLAAIKTRLARLDAFSRRGPWTLAALGMIRKHPGLPAGDLAAKLGFETEWLKVQVRKLKEMGLTVSLMPGYQLSPRGDVVMRQNWK